MTHLSIDATASPASRNSASEHFPTPEKKTALGDFDCRSTISRAYRCDHHVALSRKPKCGVTEFDHGKVASPCRVKRNSMVHHDEWKWTAPNGSDQIGEHRDRRGGNRPHLLVNLRHDRGNSLLRERRERQSRNASNYCNEVPPPHRCVPLPCITRA